MTARGRRTNPLIDALTWSGLGFPAEVWAAIATALAPRTTTYTAADATAFAAAHPEVVRRIEAGDGSATFAGTGTGVSARPGGEDQIAVALVALYPDSAGAVRSYLDRVLADWCADGAGRSVEALRSLPVTADVARILGKALMLRADRETEPTGNRLRREAITRFLAAGLRAQGAEALFYLARGERDTGDLDQALSTVAEAAAIYHDLAREQDFYLRFLALTRLDEGRLLRSAGRRRPARAAMREALRLFQLIAAGDHRFLDEVAVARMELKSLRWPRPLPLR